VKLSRPIGRRVGAALVAALTLLTATSIATPATAATTATISGRVSAADTGASIPMALVTLIRFDPNVPTMVGQAAMTTMTGTDGTYSIAIGSLTAGKYTLRFGEAYEPPYRAENWNDKPLWSTPDYFDLNPSASLTGMNAALTRGPSIPTSRLAGVDRFATSVAVSSQFPRFEPGTGMVFVADGMGYADALSGAPAAASWDAPLLLTSPTALPVAVKNEIQRLAPQTIVVIGGPGAVSDSVYGELSRYAPEITRVYGEDRYETSRALAWAAFGGDGAESAFIATGTDYPDALAASAAAGAIDAPVILVNGSARVVGQDTSSLLEALGTSQLLIAGGTAVVSPGMESALRSLPFISSVTRLAGEDRYLTSRAINQSQFTESDTMFLAVGTGFADALAGAALAGQMQAPLYLVPATCVPRTVLSEIGRLGASNAILLGGTGALAPSVASLVPCAG
jgi:putative cell wall-binding protein